jgi:hypothetical protein
MNLYIAWIAFVFFICENKYFGWNAFPQSDAELIADGIVLILFSMSLKKSGS